VWIEFISFGDGMNSCFDSHVREFDEINNNQILKNNSTRGNG